MGSAPEHEPQGFPFQEKISATACTDSQKFVLIVVALLAEPAAAPLLSTNRKKIREEIHRKKNTRRDRSRKSIWQAEHAEQRY